MNRYPNRRNIFFVLSSLFLLSCQAPRTVYLSNTMPVPVILEVDTQKLSPASVSSTFVDSLQGRYIEPGHLILHFGPGKWKKADKEQLTAILQQTYVVKEGNHYPLPGHFRVKHYGAFVNELVVRIKQ